MRYMLTIGRGDSMISGGNGIHRPIVHALEFSHIPNPGKAPPHGAQREI